MDIEIFNQIKLNLNISRTPSSIYIDQFQVYIGTLNGQLIIYSISINSKSEQQQSEQQTESESSSETEPVQESEFQSGSTLEFQSQSQSQSALDPDPDPDPDPESQSIKSNQDPCTKTTRTTPIEFKLIKTIDHFTSNPITTPNKSKLTNSTNPSIDSINLIKEINSILTLVSGDIFLHDLKTFKLLSNTHQWTKSQASLMTTKTSILRQDRNGLVLDLLPKMNDQTPSPPPTSSSKSQSQSTEEQIKQAESQEPVTSDLNSGVPVILTLLAVPCKRRLILFAWKDAQWITPKEIPIPHQARSVVFSTSLQIFIGYSTGEYAQIKLQIHSTDTLTQISHQISDPFQLPIQTRRTDPNAPLNASSSSNTAGSTTNSSGGLVSGLFKTTGLASLTLSGSNKMSKNSVLSVGSPTNEVIGIRDQLATFMNPDGKLSRIPPNPSTINYPTSPIESVVQAPYLISLLPTTTTSGSSLMIHSLPTLTHVQSIPLSSLDQNKSLQGTDHSPRKKQILSNEEALLRRLLTVSSAHNGPVVCVSPTLNESDHKINYTLEAFMMVSWAEQINRFIEAGEYLESLALIERLDVAVLPNRESLLKRLNGLCALLDFMNQNFNKSIDEFIKLNINPAKVVSLYHERIAGKLNRSKEVWEFLFGGRSLESYLKVHSDLSSLIEGSSDKGSKPSSLMNPSKVVIQKVGDDDRGSIKSFRSQGIHSLKAKPSDLSIQKPKIEIQDESHFKESIDVLIRYLTDRRQHVNKAFSKLNLESNSSSNNSESSLDVLKAIDLRSPEELFELKDIPIDEISNPEDVVQIAKIIDTTLFKCYLAVKPTMLGPLCRLPNWCEVDEVESLLMDAKRYHELLDLYHGKKQHDRALKLLKTMGESEEDLEERIDPTIRYLQKLGPNHLHLIFNTSQWIFSIIKPFSSTSITTTTNKLLNKSLEIFTADLSTVESLPKKEVMKFLEGVDLLACRIYLEFLVNDEIGENRTEIHEKLIHLYINEFRRLKALGEEETSKKIYQSLLNHLIKSESYSPNWVLGRLPLDEMFEARALTLGKIGQHDTALGIYINRLGNIQMAEEYCKRIYTQDPELIGEKIYLILLKIYLRPTPIQGMQSNGQVEEDPQVVPLLNNQIRLKASLKLLKEEGHVIKSIEEVLNLLPNWIELIELRSFLKKSLGRLNQVKREIRIEKECLENRCQSLKVLAFGVEERRIKIDEKRLCMKCGKRIGNSVMAVHSPFGEVTHYQCRWEGEENRYGSRNER